MSPSSSNEEREISAQRQPTHYVVSMERSTNADAASSPSRPTGQFQDIGSSLPMHLEAIASSWPREPEQQQGPVLAEVLSSLVGQLAALGSMVTGMQGEVVALRREVADRSTEQKETTLALIEASQAAQAQRLADFERSVGSLGATFAETQTSVRGATDLMVEMQLLAAIEVDAGLDRLGRRLETALRQSLDQKLSERLGQRFAELTSQLTEAIGIAVADRDLLAQIADPAGGTDIAEAMSILGIDGRAKRTTPLAQAPARRDVWFVKGYSDRATSPAAPLPDPATLAEPLLDVDFRSGWSGKAWAQGKTLLEREGLARADGPCPRLGFVGPTISCPAGGLIEVEIELGERTGPQDVILRLQTETGFPVGHDFVLREGRTRIRAFAPHRTQQLKFHVLMLDAPTGASFRTGRLILRRIGGEDHRQAVNARVGELVLASMASIPSRRDMLRDCVASLLLQCDRVRVFLNGYPDIPDFLTHPRVEVRRSQDWDDRGDAGKFFWIDKDREEGGYRVIADDDLIFPPDFVEVMTGKVAAAGKRAIFASHGVLLRQPLARYYEPSSRAATFHFGHALETDRTVHIGATNALCYHASAIQMTWDDFKYCNSADVWLSLHAKGNALPILTPSRPRNWIRENAHAVPDETIYQHSLKRTRTRFDSSRVQDAVLRRAWPLTVVAGDRAKIAIAIEARTTEGLRAAVAHWLATAATAGAETEFVVVLAHGGADPAMSHAITELQIPHETHLIALDRNGSGLGPTLETLAQRLRVDVTLAVQEQVRTALAARDDDDISTDEERVELTRRPGADGRTGWAAPECGSLLAFARCSGDRGDAALAALLGGRPLSAAQTDGLICFDAADVPLSEANPVAGKETRSPRRGGRSRKLVTVNDVFQRVVVMNLDRRPDRWAKTTERLKGVGIVAERFSAIDGSLPAIAEEYTAYAARPLHRVSPELPKIAYSHDLYMDYPSQMARVAHIEGETGRKAIASAGAWGYLRSYETLLERSLDAQDETLLIFDDDVVFHRDFKRLFSEAVAQLPDDWLIVQLGTLQYNWSDPWARWRTPMLYQTNGSAIGSHAVGMRFDAMPFLLDHIKRMDMPCDIGALSAATRAFPDRCFVIHPHLAIQSLDGSDIGTSRFQQGRTIAEMAATYRWNLDDYVFSPRARRSRQR